uniref:WRKY transcription factor 19 n=1 Tax=Timema monikensis TaxID=170555 RepID=A0A7R9E8Z7_9NEOP|nr:unnamed protein product [Timema monikensis]
MEVNLQNETNKQIFGLKEEITFDAEAELDPPEYVNMTLNFKSEILEKYEPDHVYDPPSFRDEHEASFEFSAHLKDRIKQESEDYESDGLMTETTSYYPTPVIKGIKRIRPHHRLLSDDPIPLRVRLLSDCPSVENLDSLMQRPPVTALCERPKSDTKPTPSTLPWCDYARRLLCGCDIRTVIANDYSHMQTAPLSFSLDNKLELACPLKDKTLSPPLPDPLPLHWAPKVKDKMVVIEDPLFSHSCDGKLDTLTVDKHPTVLDRSHTGGCQESGCSRSPLNNGFSRPHEGTRPYTKCKAESCSKCAWKGGFCTSHGGAQTRAVCRTEGCSKFSQKGGYCCSHGEVSYRCKEKDCPKYALKGGHCKGHGGTSVRSGCKARACPKHAVKGGYCWSHGGTRPHAKCVQGGCPKFSQKDGLCKAHWSSRRRKCITDECESNALRAGWSDALVG